MPSKAFSFRLPDDIVQIVESLQLDGETLNQTAQRLFIDSLKKSTELSTKVSTDVDIQQLVKQEINSAIANSELLQELIASKTAYLATSLNEVKREVDERLVKLNA